jgi:hypothetical protein
VKRNSPSLCDVAQGGRVASRAIVMQRNMHRPVQFELNEQTRDAVKTWITQARLTGDQFQLLTRIAAFVHATVGEDRELAFSCRFAPEAVVRLRFTRTASESLSVCGSMRPRRDFPKGHFNGPIQRHTLAQDGRVRWRRALYTAY